MESGRAVRTVTFDVYSALVDSATGGSRAFAALAEQRGWAADPHAAYARWDAICKTLQRDVDEYVSFHSLAEQAMADLQHELGLAGDPHVDAESLLDTVSAWPHYDDVPEAIADVAASHDVAVLTNIDDDLFARTDTGWHFHTAITSERARCYKPNAGIYRFALEQLGPLVHVAASARDVRGSLEAGLDVVRVVRPGHQVDPDGPAPRWVVDDLRELPAVLAQLERS